MALTTLISAEQLLALLAEREPVTLLDVSFDLADPSAGERSWREGHVPGSRYLHLDRELAGPKTASSGRHPLPDREVFARTLGKNGVRPGQQVVAMDRQGGVYAARLWWLLRWMGHEEVAVLDGGVAAWTRAGGALDTQVPTESSVLPYPPRPTLVAAVGADALEQQSSRWQLLDARAPERFRGDVEPLDPVAGHIPGALNRFFKDNLDDLGRFKSAGDLRREFEALLGGRALGEVVHQCGSGVTACHNLLAMEHVGLGGTRLYPGSWSEWCSDPRRPVAKGDA